jgi:hypothetical protein
MGRETNSPPQFGQRPRSVVSAQSRQKVHSKLQIMASAASGGRSLLQHSQLGRISNTAVSPGGRRLEILAQRHRPGLDLGVVTRALASIEHAVVANDPMADAGTPEPPRPMPRGRRALRPARRRATTVAVGCYRLVE